MLTLPSSVRVYLALDPVSMHLSFDRLAGLVRELGLDPMTGHLFVFINRPAKHMKVLFYDRPGFTLLYQAGADPHIDDPLGGALTSSQLARRDDLVLDGCRALGLPVVWNLAGGCQEPISRVLDIHAATARACVRAFPCSPSPRPGATRTRAAPGDLVGATARRP